MMPKDSRERALLPQLRHELVVSNGVELHVVRAGKGPPVILLHGFPEFWYSWRHQIGPLVEAGFSVIAPDMRGYNLSAKPAGLEPYRLEHLVDDVATLVEASGAARAHVVGHDWGGVVAWATAIMRPGIVATLSILNAPHPHIYLRRVRRLPQMLMSWYVLFFQLPLVPELALRSGDYRRVRSILRSTPCRPDAFSEAEIDRYVEALARPGALTAALNYYRATRLPGSLDRVSTADPIDAETLVIWGEHDSALHVELLDGLERLAPRRRLHRLPNASHWVQNDAHEEVTRLLVMFLEEFERRQTPTRGTAFEGRSDETRRGPGR